MTELALIERVEWQGLACTRLRLPNGDAAVVSDFGAQVLSWVVEGQERLFVSTRAVLDGSAPIRGGIPVCFPQFNNRGGLPKHGFVRTSVWEAPTAADPCSAHEITAVWTLRDSCATRAMWPFAFTTQLHVQLAPGQLEIGLIVHNTGEQAWPFTAALHSYLRTEDVAACQLHGLDGQPFWDAAQAFAPSLQTGAVAFGGEVDRVYPRPAQALQLEGALAGRVQIAQDAKWSEAVVWNPGPALCAQLGDMAPEGWQHMLCVEAAAINQPVALRPGGQWHAAQRLAVHAAG